jgi:MauM/NapG family ferredoxin protein
MNGDTARPRSSQRAGRTGSKRPRDRPGRVHTWLDASPVSWTRRARILYQGFFLALFLLLLERLAAGDPHRLPFTVYEHLDPLAAVGVTFAQGTLPGALVWSAVLILMTLVLGRVFCGWICPLGTLQQVGSRLLSPRSRRESLTINRYRRWYALKYYILAALLVLALAGSLQVGLLDPLSLLGRGLASGLWPALPHGRPVPGGWLAAGLLLAIVLASRWIPRVFCRALCPLGALLGVFARFSLFRIHREGDGCSSCSLCTFACQGADEPLGEHRAGECHVCLNCIPGCPDGAIRYAFLTPAAGAPEQPDISRRYLLGTVLGGIAVAPLLRAAGGGRDVARAGLIRPPGALTEPDFLARCVKCSLCQQACPTGGLQPAIAQAGVEGFWSPVLVPRRGWCEFACTRCGEVCPTGAIAHLSAARKTGYDGMPAVRIGTAFVDRGRCLPWAMATPCVVCEEMCPTDPKAIWLEEVHERDRDGREVRLQRPHIEPPRCVGCGICEHDCPVGEKAAIRVSSVGETRDPLNRLMLDEVQP